VFVIAVVAYPISTFVGGLSPVDSTIATDDPNSFTNIVWTCN